MRDSNILNALIVDDEIQACKNLDYFLTEFLSDKVKVCGYCHNLDDARAYIISQKPDIVFLDIEIADENAFALIENIHTLNFETIFVTAHEQYALKALKLNVIDYLLKPIDTKELIIAVEKIIIKVSKITPNEVKYDSQNSKKIILKDYQNNHRIIDIDDVIHVQSIKNYSKIFFIDEKQISSLIMCKSIAEYEKLLPAALFIRIHRSYLVNYIHVKSLSVENQSLLLINNLIIPISRRRCSEVLAFFKRKK